MLSIITMLCSLTSISRDWTFEQQVTPQKHQRFPIRANGARIQDQVHLKRRFLCVFPTIQKFYTYIHESGSSAIVQNSSAWKLRQGKACISIFVLTAVGCGMNIEELDSFQRFHDTSIDQFVRWLIFLEKTQAPLFSKQEVDQETNCTYVILLYSNIQDRLARFQPLLS